MQMIPEKHSIMDQYETGTVSSAVSMLVSEWTVVTGRAYGGVHVAFVVVA